MLTEADVVIIGGGIFGSSTAFNLSKETKLKVAVVEKDPTGGASTGKSAAIVRHFYSTDLLVKTALGSRKIYQNFETEIGEPLEYVHNTELVLSAQGEAVNDFEGRLKRFGIDAKMIYPDEIRKRFPFLNTEEVVCGLLDLDAGFVYSPLEAVSIYTRQAQKLGANVYNNTRATGIKIQDGSVKSVTTDKGEISTDVVVNTAGAWGRQVGEMAGLDLPIDPQRQQLVDLKVNGEWPLTRPTIADHVQRLYIIPRKGGIVHVGGHYFGKDCDPDNYIQGADSEYIEDVSRRASKRVPSLKDAKLLRGYSALYDNTPDVYPIVGEADQVKGFFNCVGWSGHGFKHGPMFGILMKELIETGKTSLDIGILSLKRFKTGQLIKSAEGAKAPFG